MKHCGFLTVMTSGGHKRLNIAGGFLFQNDLYCKDNLCTKFHAFIKKCTKKCLGAVIEALHLLLD